MRTEQHLHLLPAVDDGPRDEQDAVALARAGGEDGTSRFVLTPHVLSLSDAFGVDGSPAQSALISGG